MTAAKKAARSAPARSAPAGKRSAPKKAAHPAKKSVPASKAAAKHTPAKKATGKKTPKSKAARSPKRAQAKKPAPAKRAAPVKKAPAVKKAAALKKTAPARKVSPSRPAPPAAGRKPAGAKAPGPGSLDKAQAPGKAAATRRAPVGPYATEQKFLDEQRELLLGERSVYEGQANDLRAEADSLALEREPGDVQFDEESGEGGTVTVDRERNLALSAQASAAVEEIDDALRKIERKAYGACERCGQAIPKARLRALPFARLCVACKSGGLSRR